MVVGKFGPKTFEVSKNRICTFRDFSVSGELEVSSEEAAKKKPATTVKGPGLLKIGFEVPLLAAAGISVQSEIDSWMAVKDAGKDYPFILCGKAVSLYGFLLTNCAASDYVISKVSGAPVLVSAVLKLEFTEYLPPGVGSSGSKKKKSSAAGVKANIGVSNPYKVPSTTQKGNAKRVNKGMTG